MKKYAILLGYFDKQETLIKKLLAELLTVDLSVYEKRYLFSLKAQQFYTAIEDFLKQIVKRFENHLDDISELLTRLSTEIPQIRPAVLSKESFLFLDKIRSFRHFIRHAYDCELEEDELKQIQKQLSDSAPKLQEDFCAFRRFVTDLSQ